MLDVSPASVNEMIGKLEGRGLADHEKYKGVELTDEGIVRAREALQTYCIIERFLANVLEVEEFREEARALESVIDDTVAERLDTIIDRRAECPDCFSAETDACEHLDVPLEVEGAD
jgi:Mn-dependent DtxR family transcriptional regulator